MGTKKRGRRTVQLSLTIDKEVMEKFYGLRARDSPLWVLPRSTLITYILDWALGQKNLEDELIKMVKAKYKDTYQAWRKDWVAKKL